MTPAATRPGIEFTGNDVHHRCVPADIRVGFEVWSVRNNVGTACQFRVLDEGGRLIDAGFPVRNPDYDPTIPGSFEYLHDDTGILVEWETNISVDEPIPLTALRFNHEGPCR